MYTFQCIEVSDGWYCLDAIIDSPLTVLVQRSIITTGSKIVSFSSQIEGSHGDGEFHVLLYCTCTFYYYPTRAHVTDVLLCIC